jgi:dihydroxyacetone kinase DhaKLM complex PTS-EIIA-like component DhaM
MGRFSHQSAAQSRGGSRQSRLALIVLRDNDESLLKTNVEAIMAAIDAAEPGGLLWVDLGSGAAG